ncbi:uncharacterized protein LOC112175959 isoform X3 [Rosa chinensis]|uniref:uncharacterized protein LOC112175959 isoform X3 n=1 Tax=Rosa chinensis TaxID=74649 RepID=UPI001AD94465|nr:uncharacterized protein LOC112175959 isoform X3 [Rosa chinensis]XP_040367607.1 uncharacterized protein LOC112175959 isoform X3 [Rosa chinensis]XP_040367608.1 uncharacterized protein LOC112175959 isoform X3 [Rosa chinensis]XP_040367609.1 uncharacterized protein LOC112175959 isoform X3 [Rosa chinensis]
MQIRALFYSHCKELVSKTMNFLERRWEVPVPRAIEVIYSSSSGEGTDPRFVKLAPVFRCSMLKSGDKKKADSTVSLVLPWSTDPGIMHKADYLFKLLLKSPVPAPLAIELALFGRKHDLIKLGTLKGGICKKYGINKEKIDILRRRLERSLKELFCVKCSLKVCEVFSNVRLCSSTRMEGALSMVESSLEKYGISCTLNLIKRTVTISTTGATKEYPDALEKARHLLQLLTTTNVPAISGTNCRSFLLLFYLTSTVAG